MGLFRKRCNHRSATFFACLVTAVVAASVMVHGLRDSHSRHTRVPPTPEPMHKWVSENHDASRSRAKKTVEPEFNEKDWASHDHEATARADQKVAIPSETTANDHAADKHHDASETHREVDNPLSTKPLLPEDHPSWVNRAPKTDGDFHFVSVGSTPGSTFDESLRNLDEPLLDEVRQYVDRYVLNFQGAAAELKQLTPAWIREHWMKDARQYDATLDMDSGTYHQAWVELVIPPSDREIIRDWSVENNRNRRILQLGSGAGAVVGVLALFHWGLGLFVRRKPTSNPGPATV